MAHKALDSGNFFDYLHPSLGGVTVYGIPEQPASSSQRVSSGTGGGDESSARDVGRSSGSSLFARLASKQNGVEFPAASRIQSDTPAWSPEKGVPVSPSKALAMELCKGSPPSRLLSRVLGKRQRDSPLKLDDDDDCVIMSGPSGGSGTSSSPSSNSSKHDMMVVHDFAMPLEPPEVLERMKAKKKEKGQKRARRGRAGQAHVEIEGEPIGVPQGWCPVPVADILFQIAEPSSSGQDRPGPSLDPCSQSYYKEVRRAGQDHKSFSAILEALKCAGIQTVFPYIVNASWPHNYEEWKPLQTDLTVWQDSLNIANSGLCDCIFRSQMHDDLSILGGSASRGEAIHVQLRLNPSSIASTLASQLTSQQRSLDSIHMHGARITGRSVEWRVAPYKRSKRRKRVDTSFRLLDNRDDSLANQPPNFMKWPLRREQLRSLKWMEQAEAQSMAFDLTLNQLQVDPTSEIVTSDDAPPPGSDGSLSSDYIVKWRYELRCREFYNIRGGILGDAVGYGKTATMIGLIDSRHCSNHPIVPDSKEPYFFTSNATLVLVPSNLLDQWVGEFQKFLDCHIGTRMAMEGERTPLRVVPIRTATQLKALNVTQICKEADVIICSYRLLFSPVYRRRLLELAGNFADIAKSDSVAVRAAANVGDLRSNTKRFRDNPLEVGWKHRRETVCAGTLEVLRLPGSAENIVDDPSKLRFPVLEQFWWRRIVFDEFHELEAMGNTAQFASLKNLCGHYRWGLTGTPPTRDLDQISVLAQLFQIDNLLQCRESAGEEVAKNMAQGFLDRFARQNTGQEALPVELREHIIEVHQTPEERAIYLQALHDTSANAGNADIADPSHSSHDMDASKSERLLKLCSHFAYGVGAAASCNADNECGRLLTLKQNSISQALAALRKISKKCELLWRLLPAMDCDPSIPFAAPRSLQSDSEALIQKLRDRFNIEQSVPLEKDSVLALEPAAEPVSSTCEQHLDLQHSCGDACRTACEKSEAETAPLPAFDIAISVLKESRSLSSPELHSKQDRSRNQAQPLEEVLNRLPSGTISSEAADRAREDAKTRFLAAVDAYDSAYRSRCFLENALAATRGEASSEERSCSICLDEDIPREELSITSCAHIFHTACIAEVVAKMGTCPMCRKRLDASKDLTPLAAEVPCEPDRPAQKLDETDPEVANRFGSKLAAIAARLQAIKAQGEKAIVFCQWEDLKRKVADALSIIGLDHFELSGNVYQRSEVIRRFQEESGPDVAHVLLLSLEHSASGTNLTAANHIVFVHPMSAISSDKAVSYEAQAIGRCRRWGQAKTEVHCWRFVTRGTVEEAITAEHRRDLWKTYLSKE